MAYNCGLIQSFDCMSFEIFNKYFYVDRGSPSGLRWKITANSNRLKDSIAGKLDSHGYWRVHFQGSSYGIHTIIMVLISKEESMGRTVHHIDFCPSNNNLDNLMWATRSEQNKLRRKSGFATMDNTLNEFEKLKSQSLDYRAKILEK